MKVSSRSVGVVALTLAAFACAQQKQPEPKPAPETRKTGDQTKAVFDFDAAVTGSVPKGWTVAETKGAGTPAAWRVEALKDDAKHKNAVKVDTKNKESVFNLLLSETSYAADLDLSVAIKAATGDDDQGGGLVWRAKDADNYYITRWNPLENNIRVYKVEAGQRTMFKSAEAVADPKQWHTIAVTHRGAKITVKLDDKVVLEAEDSTFKDAGKVGFWTKADASSWFDDLVVAWQKK